ncbi:MAG: DNA repair protein RecN [Bacteroidia bacterium]
MLLNLSIKNYALIEEINVDFSDGLNVITGETGSGKSIIIGALGLVLGDRADMSSAKNKDEKCLVEATFDISKLKLKTFFSDNELDFDKKTIVRREITPQGKSRAFINDTPVNLQLLKEFSSYVIDVHSQHQTLEINNQAYQLELVDALAGSTKELDSYQEKFSEYTSAVKELDRLKNLEAASNQELDYSLFLLKEFEGLDLENIHQQALEQEQSTLENSEEIKQVLSTSHNILEQDERGALSLLRQVKIQLEKISGYNQSFEHLLQRMEANLIELRDFSSELEQLNEKVEFNPERLNNISELLSKCYVLQKKHNVNTNEELLKIKQELEEKVKNISSLDEKIAKQQSEVGVVLKSLKDSASKLTKKREASFSKIEKQVKELLSSVGMASAEIKIQNTKKDFSPNGTDDILFLAKTNKGTEFKPMSQIASGGELSRIVLVLKSILSKYQSLPTIIFDEIDAGISGEVADKVGQLMRKLSENIQVFSVTHLPQVASKGHHHYFVYKEENKKDTRTHIKLLTKEERVTELAKMMSGEKLTKASLQSAQELIDAVG